jgi:redox-sensitive bicupin YhaK (pirin superfamily)
MGFGTHPHDNMEITIPLEGDLAHKDSREMQPQSKMVM